MSQAITIAFERYQAGDLAAAERHCREALAAEANLADGWLLLGTLADHAGAKAEAERYLRRATELAPGNPRAWNALGTARMAANDFDRAKEAFETAIRVRSDYAAAWHNLGEVERALGRHRIAADRYRRALQCDPHLEPASSNLLFSLHFDPELSDAEIWAEHTRWGEALAVRTVPLDPPVNSADPDRPVVIGYIGPDFREHAVARFFEPLLAAHDRTRFRMVLYSECPIVDSVGRRLRGHGDLWRVIRGQPAPAIARQMRQDGVDILVELAGHTRDNRLDVLALRPAPVQMTFLGYPFGTGLSHGRRRFECCRDFALRPRQTRKDLRANRSESARHVCRPLRCGAGVRNPRSGRVSKPAGDSVQTFILCRNATRAKKEQASPTRFATSIEEGLQ